MAKWSFVNGVVFTVGNYQAQCKSYIFYGVWDWLVHVTRTLEKNTLFVKRRCSLGRWGGTTYGYLRGVDMGFIVGILNIMI